MTALRDAELHLLSQYQTVSVARNDAHDAVDWARNLYEGAKVVVQS